MRQRFWVYGGTDNDIIESRRLGARERRSMFRSITSTQGEPDWGDDPSFLVIEVPDGTRRKILIVDATRRFCTFRSTTTDPRYMPIIADPHLSRGGWTMQCRTRASRYFVRSLNVLDNEV